ncbi:MAG: RNase adapter RapZ [Thermodesulfovibrionia bacterium]|nr:RNase adapter RapZ [Thermodesulfovibrionia bacterium]
MQSIKIVILTGLSGSGKSTAIRALEDLDFFCVDNFPPVLLPKFIELCKASSGEISKIAMVMDIRERAFLKEYPDIFKGLKKKGEKIDILFLESSDEALVRRFKETRRQHPLAEKGSVLEGIKRERGKLSDLRMLASEILDTSSLTVHQLREVITQLFSKVSNKKKMSITLTSFGYKFGIPYDTDLMMDVRFLPNPFFVSDLRDLSGNDKSVQNYVMKNKVAENFQKKFLSLINFLIPQYKKEGKTYLAIGVGCTGGQHRSVVVINSLENILSKKDCLVRVVHRDLGKG